MVKKFSRILTAKDSPDRLATKPEIEYHKGEAQSKRKIKINPAETYQTVMGFGGAFTEAGAYTLHRLPENK